MPAGATTTEAGGDPARSSPPSRALWALTAAAVVVGSVLRFVAPTPLWLDEALSADLAALPIGDLLDALGRDGHPPLYYLLLHGWMDLAGTGDGAVRALSGLLSVAALPLVYVIGRRRGGGVLGALAVTMLAVSPFAVRYGSEARMYSLVVVEVLVGWLLLDDLLQGRPARSRVPLLALVSGALLLTHYWGAMVIGATVAVLVVSAWRADDGAARRRPLLGAGALAMGGLLFLPWVPTLVDQLAHTGTPWAPPTRPSAAVGATLRDLAGGPTDDGVLAAGVLVVLLAIGLTGTAVGAGRISLDLRTVPTVRGEAAVAALTLVGGATVAFLAGSTFVTRYAAVILPLVVVIAAAGLACVSPRAAQLGALAAVVALGLVGTAAQLRLERTQAGVVAASLTERLGADRSGTPEGALVVVCPDQLGPATARALWGPAPVDGAPDPPADAVQIITYPGLGDPRLVDWYDYAERAAAADPEQAAAEALALVGPETPIALVWSSGYRTFPKACGALRDALAASRPGAEDLVIEDGLGHFEPATLTWFPAAGP